MREIGIRQLKERASEVIRQVREGNEAITVTYRGRPVARIVPVSEIDRSRAATSAVWAEMDELAEEVAGVGRRGCPPQKRSKKRGGSSSRLLKKGSKCRI